MPGLQNIYCNSLRRNYGYHAAWSPGVALALGEVGRFSDGIFIRETSLKNLGIPFRILSKGSKLDIQPFQSSSSISMTFKGSADPVPPNTGLAAGKAGLSVSFGSENGVVFAADKCVSTQIDDVAQLGVFIRERYDDDRAAKARQWKAEYVVITELVTASTMTVLISKEAGAQIDLVAEGKLTAGGLGSLANANAKFAIKTAKKMNTKLVGAEGGTPLFRVYGLSWPWYWPWASPDFNPKISAAAGVPPKVAPTFAMSPPKK
jgi:hypothetical protein